MNIRQRKAERHKEMLRKLSQEGGNRYCFDCDMRGPLYVVSDFNILVCAGCSAVHRSFQHKVKGITMSEFGEDEIACLMLGGNDTAEKVWLSTFKGQHPRSGNVLALKDFIKDIFIDRRYCDQGAYTNLLKSWENPQAALTANSLAASPPAAATAPSLPPPPAPAPFEARSPVLPARSSTEPQKNALAPTTAVAAPPPPSRPVQNSVFDDLFAAPVHAPVMSPRQQSQFPPATSAPATVPPPTLPPEVSSLVDDLFASAPAPAPVTSAPTSSYNSAQPQLYSGFGGPANPQSMAAPPQQTPYISNDCYSSQSFSSELPQQQHQCYPQQQQQQFYDFSAPPPQANCANAQKSSVRVHNSAFFTPPIQQQQQQYSGYSGAFGAPPVQAQVLYAAHGNPVQPPFADLPEQQQQQQQQLHQHHSHVVDVNAPPPMHTTHMDDPFKNLGDPSVFAYLGGPSTTSHPASREAQPFAWGEPSPQQQQQRQQQNNYSTGAPTSNASPNPNRGRIAVLSVTKSSEPPTDIPPMRQ